MTCTETVTSSATYCGAPYTIYLPGTEPGTTTGWTFKKTDKVTGVKMQARLPGMIFIGKHLIKPMKFYDLWLAEKEQRRRNKGE